MAHNVGKLKTYKEDFFMIFDNIYKKTNTPLTQTDYVIRACKICGLTSNVRKDVRQYYNEWKEERGL